MGLYTELGYVDVAYCLRYKCPFTFIIGGRGTGKTYGALRYALDSDLPFILMRRTQAQADLISRTEFSPLEPVVRDMGLQQTVKALSKYNGGIYVHSPEDPEDDPGRMVGWTAALSTFSNLRGFDASDIQLIVYDECIPETHERPLKNEGDALLNVYETVNRNRELSGRDPVTMLLLSNANRLDSPILDALGLVPVLEKMLKCGKEEHIDRERGVALFLPFRSRISREKADTALYRAARSGTYAEMALANQFAYDDMSDVRPQKLTGWKLRMQLGPLFIYSKAEQWYITMHGAGTPALRYEWTDNDRKRFIRDFPSSYTRLIDHRILFEDYSSRLIFCQLFG